MDDLPPSDKQPERMTREELEMEVAYLRCCYWDAACTLSEYIPNMVTFRQRSDSNKAEFERLRQKYLGVTNG